MKKIIMIMILILSIAIYLSCTPTIETVSWIEYTETGLTPKSRYGHSLTCVNDEKVIMFGGLGVSDYLQDTWEYDISTNAWTEYNTIGTRPSLRVYHSLSFIGDNKLILFGGFDGNNYLNDTWEYDISTHTWTEYNTIGIKPIARSDHSIAYVGNGKLIMYGGRYLSGEGKYYYLQDTWEYDISTHTWMEYNEEGNNPFSRASHSISYISDDRLILFGGYVEDVGNTSDAWEYDLSNHAWLPKDTDNSPSRRVKHTMAYFGDSKVIMFGGYGDYSGKEFLSDTWVYNTDTSNWIKCDVSSQNPSARRNHSIAYIGDNRVIMFGGQDDENNILSDTWICNR